MLSIITEIRIFIGWLVGNTPGELFNYISVLNLVKISPIVSDVERDSDRNNNESPPPHRIKTNTTNNLVTNTTQLFFSLTLLGLDLKLPAILVSLATLYLYRNKVTFLVNLYLI